MILQSMLSNEKSDRGIFATTLPELFGAIRFYVKMERQRSGFRRLDSFS